MGRLLTTFKDKTFEPSMKSYFKLHTDDTTTAAQIYDSLLYVRGTNAGSLAVGQENDQGPSTVETYDTYMPVRFHNIKSASDGNTPAAPTHTFFSVYNRAEYNGPSGQNIYDLYGDYNTAKLSGAGYVTNSMGGGYNAGLDMGTGNDQTIAGIYGSLSWAEAKSTGSNRTVSYLMGSRGVSKVNSASTTATYVYPHTSEFNLTAGTVGTVALHKLDLDYTAGNITNAYFIWADESSLPTPSGEKYFIKSNIPWETLLSGTLTNTGAVTFNSTLAVTGAATFNTSVSLLDNDFLYLGTGTDFRAFHNGTDTYLENSTGELRIMSNDWALRSMSTEIIGYDTTDDYVKFSKDARWIDNEKVLLGTSGDLSVFHNGTDSYLENDTGNLFIVNKADDKDIRFQTDNGSGGTTTYFTIDGVNELNQFSKNVSLPDSVIARFGTSSDLQIFHDGSNSYINETGTGELRIQGSNNITFYSQLTSEVMAKMINDGGVELYYNNSKKIETTNTGVSVTGGLTTTSTVILSNLPTSDPSVAGQLWNSSGDLKISAG